MPLKNCHTTFSLQRSTSSSSLTLNACFRYSSATINRIGSRRLLRGLTPAPASCSVVPNRSLCANNGASVASICCHGIRVASTANG